MSVTFQIAKNTLTSWGCSLLNGVLGWVLVPIYLAHLGREGYGLIGLAAAIVTYTIIADFGLRDSLGRQLAAEAALKDRQAFNRLVSSACVFYLFLSVAIGLAMYLCATRIAHFFAVSPQCLDQAIFLLRWFAPLATLMTFIGSVAGAVLASENRFDKLNLTNSAVYAIRALSLILVLNFTDMGLYGWATVTLVTESARVWMLWRVSARLRADLHVSMFQFRPAIIISLAGLGLYSIAAQFASLLSAQSDPLVLSCYFGPAILVLYAPAAQLLNATRPFVYAIASQLCPVATNYHVLDAQQELANVLTAGTKYQVLLGAGALAVAIGFSNSIVHVWLGSKLGADCQMAATVLATLGVAELLAFLAGTQWPVLLAMRRLQVFLLVAVPAGILYIGTSVALVGYTHLGIWGVLIPNLVISFIERVIFAKYTASQCHLRLRDYIKASYVQPLIVFTILLLVCIGLDHLLEPRSYLTLAACAMAGFILWGALCWWLALSAAERTGLGMIIRRCRQSFNQAALARAVKQLVHGATLD